MTAIEIAILALVIALLASLKGGFGGGFGALGIPLLAVVMDPIRAGGLLAPLFIVMDVFALRYWKPSTWSKVDAFALAPFMIVGIGLGYALLSMLDGRLIALLIGLISLAFAAYAILVRAPPKILPPSRLLAALAGTAGGFTSMAAHSGGPPIVMYLQSRGLDKMLYTGTTSIVFSVGNVVKLGPWLALSPPSSTDFVLLLAAVPLCAVGVWLGWRMHNQVNQAQLFLWCNLLLAATGLKLVWDGAI